jgi:hypothetical protein
MCTAALHVLRNTKSDKNNLQFSNNDCTKEIISSIAKAIVPDGVFRFPFHFCKIIFHDNFAFSSSASIVQLLTLQLSIFLSFTWMVNNGLKAFILIHSFTLQKRSIQQNQP